MRVEPDLREGGGYVVPDEISRDEDVSKVVRPRFRMGLKPTALLRHTAKVRLTCGSLRMTRDGMLRSIFLFSHPLSVTASRASSPIRRASVAVALATRGGKEENFAKTEQKRSRRGSPPPGGRRSQADLYQAGHTPRCQMFLKDL